MKTQSWHRSQKALGITLNILGLSFDEYNALIFRLGIEKVERDYNYKIDINKTKEYWEWVSISFFAYEKVILEKYELCINQNYSDNEMRKFYKLVKKDIEQSLLRVDISEPRWEYINAEYNKMYKITTTAKKPPCKPRTPKVKNNQLETNLNTI